jgi:hypothetical protein
MKKPDYKAYFPNETNPPGAMKKYIIDSIKYLQEQGNQEALEIPIDMLDQLFDDEMTITNNPNDFPPLTQMVLMKLINSSFAGDLFDGMLGQVGSSVAELKEVRENGPNRKMPGIPNHKSKKRISNEEMTSLMFEQIQKEMYAKMGPHLLRAAVTGNVSDLKAKVIGMEEALKSSLEIIPEASEDAQLKIQEMIDYTEMFTQLVDPEQTTPESFDRFMNVLITQFVYNRVEELNREIEEHSSEHEDHDPEDCQIEDAKNFGAPAMHVLWRRFHGNESEKNRYPIINSLDSVSCVVFDAFHNSIEFIGLTMHPALESPVMEQLTEDVRENEDLKVEVFKLLTDYLKNKRDLVEALQRNSDNEDHTAIMVTLSAAAPQLKMLNDCIAISASDPDGILSESDMDAGLEKLLKEL